MDIEKIKEELKNNYNCQYVTSMNYANHEIIKALESLPNGISYRYFRIANDNRLVEVIDELLLAYFKSENEISDENNY